MAFVGEVLDALLDKPSLELKCTMERTIDAPGGLEGTSFTMEFDGLTVASIREGSVSAEAGLRKGDLVTAIDGKSTRYMPISKAMSLISGSKEDAIILTVRREALIWRRD